jgi:hypothetical protein
MHDQPYLNNSLGLFVLVSNVFFLWIGIHGTYANFDKPVVFSAKMLAKITPKELGRITETLLPVL